MTVRPKDIGTAAESAVCKYLRDNGFGHAERRTLKGGKDQGDITGIPGVCVEVKGGDAARTASTNQIRAWLQEAETERANANADIGFLVAARARQNPRNWWAVMTMATHQKLMGHNLTNESLRHYPCYVTLEVAAQMLRAAGWGDPL